MAKSLDHSIVEGQCITILRGAIRSSSQTLGPYERRLLAFLSGIDKICDDFVELAKTSP
ncbi:MAG TPA: hypothetical protein VFS97_14805 [Nitrososphaeraceae archaeon]|nr:hypothetical protein [Nitrososphaeraceae archaeon]